MWKELRNLSRMGVDYIHLRDINRLHNIDYDLLVFFLESWLNKYFIILAQSINGLQ